jgi:hypothetical protein
MLLVSLMVGSHYQMTHEIDFMLFIEFILGDENTLLGDHISSEIPVRI